jgi:hypothetical protein
MSRPCRRRDDCPPHRCHSPTSASPDRLLRPLACQRAYRYLVCCKCLMHVNLSCSASIASLLDWLVGCIRRILGRGVSCKYRCAAEEPVFGLPKLSSKHTCRQHWRRTGCLLVRLIECVPLFASHTRRTFLIRSTDLLHESGRFNVTDRRRLCLD